MPRNTFRGGVHPDDSKHYARDAAFQAFFPKGDMVFLLSQHIGKPAKPVVQKGERVLAGQRIAEADGFISANVISSCSGTVKAIRSAPTVTGGLANAIIIENDQQYALAEGVGAEVDYTALTKEEIIARVKDAGIVGMGGAGFPVNVKLSPKNPDAIEYLIANGAECEPYITCDDQLMRTRAGEIVLGMKVMLRLFPNARGVIVIESNKPEAIHAMEAACAGEKNISVFRAKTKYPQGGERSIISVVAKRHLQLGMLPADVGCIVDNVATIHAIYEAVCKSMPLMKRGFTVSGDAVNAPCNLIVPVGSSFSELVEAAGGIKEGVTLKKALCGGPMMGFALANLDVAVCKNNNALTLMSFDPVEFADAHMTACLRCGRCLRACPLGLSPQLMAQAAEHYRYKSYQEKLYGLECIACGCCTYVCPAKRPLMQLFKATKAEILSGKWSQGGKK